MDEQDSDLIDDVDADDGDDDGPDYSGQSAEGEGDHAQALERLQLAAEALYKQIQREKAALRYQVPELMWSEDARSWRAGEDLGGGIIMPDRPMIAIPVIEQAVRLVLNQERAAHFGVEVHPESEDAQDETAETLTGLYRQIERESRAGLGRSWGFNRGVKCGRGCWRVKTEEAIDYARTRDQNIRISRILYQDCWLPDPFAVEPDWRDREYDFLLEWLSFSKYKKLHAKKRRIGVGGKAEELPSRLAEMSDGELTRLQEDCPAWIKGEGEGRAVLVAEYLMLERRPENAREAKRAGWLPGEYRRIVSRWMNAVEFMNRSIIHASYSPIVPAIGEELIPFDDERRWQGMYEPNKDAQNVFNYAASNAVEAMAQEPRSTWIIAEGQEVGHERELLQANIKNFPYVRYKPTTIGDQLVPGPQRTQVDSSKLGMSMEMLSMASDWVHKGTAFYEPSLGEHSPSAKTKGGTLALQQQGDVANSHWLDSMAEISMQYEACVVLSMIPYYYDRPGRVARTLGADDKDSKPVVLNRPYELRNKRPVPLPFNTPEEKRAALGRVNDPNDPAKLHNLRDGLYGLTVNIGKGYKSRIQEGATELGQIFQAEPQLFGLLGDIWLRFRDFPGHMEAAERVKRMVPQQALGDEGGEQDPKVQLEKAKAMLQQMQAKLQELEPERMKASVQMEIAKMKEETARGLKAIDVQLQAMKDATQIRVAEITATKEKEAAEREAEQEAIALGQQHAFDAAEAQKDRAHEAATQAADQAHQVAAGAAGAGAEADASDAAHQQTLEQQAAAGDQTRQTQAEGADQAAQAAEAAAAGAAESGEGEA